MFVNEDQKEVAITRAEYDVMIDRYPDFMATVWVRLWKQWNTYTIRVFQCAGSGLATRVNAIRS